MSVSTSVPRYEHLKWRALKKVKWQADYIVRAKQRLKKDQEELDKAILKARKYASLREIEEATGIPNVSVLNAERRARAKSAK